MTATQNLENDHVHILKLTDVMERIIQTTNPEITHIETVINIIRNFADGLHHAKEENLLFPLMCTKGFSKENGPVAVMLHDHIEGRDYVKGMAINLDAMKLENAPTLNLVKQNMHAYVELLRGHIQKENNILFRMADQVFTEEDQQNLIAEFNNVEEGSDNKASLNKYMVQIDELASIYL